MTRDEVKSIDRRVPILREGESLEEGKPDGT